MNSEGTQPYMYLYPDLFKLIYQGNEKYKKMTAEEHPEL